MTKRKSNRKRIALVAAILAVAGLGVWYIASTQPDSKKTASTSSEVKKTQQQTDDLNKNDPTLDKKAQTAATTTATTSSDTKTLNITISRPVNGDTLPLSEGIEIRSVISGTTTGTCNVTATGPAGKTVTKSANITAQPSYGSCSVDIKGPEVAAGDWQVAMTVTSGSAKGSANFKVKIQ